MVLFLCSFHHGCMCEMYTQLLYNTFMQGCIAYASQNNTKEIWYRGRFTTSVHETTIRGMHEHGKPVPIPVCAASRQDDAQNAVGYTLVLFHESPAMMPYGLKPNRLSSAVRQPLRSCSVAAGMLVTRTQSLAASLLAVGIKIMRRSFPGRSVMTARFPG